MDPALQSIESWIFDLDNTLYPHSCNLFELIDERMGAFIAGRFNVAPDEAHRIQKGYFASHGTTLAGLMANEDIDPHEFLHFVHDIDMTRLSPDLRLRETIAALPGRKFVFTNGDASYARKVLGALGLGQSFDGLFDIHEAGYRPKPDPACYDLMCAKLGIAPTGALFAEDMVRNLRPAKAIGMTTLWVDNGSEQAGGESCPSFVDYRTDDLAGWLVEHAGEFA